MKVSNLGALRYSVLGSILFTSEVYRIPKYDHNHHPTEDRLRELGFDLIGETNSDLNTAYNYHLAKLPSGWFEAGDKSEDFCDANGHCRLKVDLKNDSIIFNS